mgnify:CR=1 FL=1
MPYCTRCRQEIDATDNYCRQCGRALQPGTGFWYTHSGIILLMLVLGPFALITVYLSKVISRTAKAVYSILILLFTAYLGYACWQMFVLIQELLQSSLALPY